MRLRLLRNQRLNNKGERVMAITAQDVMKLRKMTSAGMMDCKKALVEADGDMDKAVDFLILCLLEIGRAHV